MNKYRTLYINIIPVAGEHAMEVISDVITLSRLLGREIFFILDNVNMLIDGSMEVWPVYDDWWRKSNKLEILD